METFQKLRGEGGVAVERTGTGRLVGDYLFFGKNLRFKKQKREDLSDLGVRREEEEL